MVSSIKELLLLLLLSLGKNHVWNYTLWVIPWTYAMKMKKVINVMTAGQLLAPGQSSGLYGVSFILFIYVYIIYPEDPIPAMHPTRATSGFDRIKRAEATLPMVPIKVGTMAGRPGVPGLEFVPVYAASAPATAAA